MKNQTIQKVVATGIGAALFVVIGLLVNIPTPLPNTSIQFQYGIQALLAVIYGPVVGFLSGFIGHTLKDALQYGPWWSWILASGLFGGLVGLIKPLLKLETGKLTFKGLLIFNLVQVAANFLLWAGLAPFLDVWFYEEPANKAYAQGVLAAVVNAVTVALIGTALLKIYSRRQVQAGSLHKLDDTK